MEPISDFERRIKALSPDKAASALAERGHETIKWLKQLDVSHRENIAAIRRAVPSAEKEAIQSYPALKGLKPTTAIVAAVACGTALWAGTKWDEHRKQAKSETRSWVQRLEVERDLARSGLQRS